MKLYKTEDTTPTKRSLVKKIKSDRRNYKTPPTRDPKAKYTKLLRYEELNLSGIPNPIAASELATKNNWQNYGNNLKLQDKRNDKVGSCME